MASTNTITTLLASLQGIITELETLSPELAAGQALATVLAQTDEPIAKILEAADKGASNLVTVQDNLAKLQAFRELADPILKDSLLAHLDGIIAAEQKAIDDGNIIVADVQTALADVQAIKAELSAQTTSIAQAVAATPAPADTTPGETTLAEPAA